MRPKGREEKEKCEAERLQGSESGRRCPEKGTLEENRNYSSLFYSGMGIATERGRDGEFTVMVNVPE